MEKYFQNAKSIFHLTTLLKYFHLAIALCVEGCLALSLHPTLLCVPEMRTACTET